MIRAHVDLIKLDACFYEVSLFFDFIKSDYVTQCTTIIATTTKESSWLWCFLSSSKGLKKVKSGDYARVKGGKLKYDTLARASHNSICNVSWRDIDRKKERLGGKQQYVTFIDFLCSRRLNENIYAAYAWENQQKQHRHRFCLLSSSYFLLTIRQRDVC